jgi:hypothetical protein
VLNSFTSFHPAGVESLLLTKDGVGNDIIDRTPSGFTASDDICWSSDIMYDAAAGSEAALIIATPTTSLSTIESEDETPIYYGSAVGTDQFQAISGITTSGFVLAVHPFLFVGGSNGLLQWSNENEPRNFTSGDASLGGVRIAANKLVAGIRTLSSNGPGALIWALDALVQVSYVGGAAIFRATTISTSTNILSSRSVVEMDNVYYWAGVDKFWVSDGTSAKELPNTQNLNWFFDNLDFTQRQKVWATKVPRWGEIWWHFPSVDGTGECDKCVIYNTRLNVWYDSESSRAAGTPARLVNYPLWTASEAVDDSYALYAHESQWDAVERNGVVSAITATATTSDIAALGSTSRDSTRLNRIEPDYIGAGTLRIEVVGRKYPQSTTTVLAAKDTTIDTEVVDVRTQARHLQLKLTSAEQGSWFELGKFNLYEEPGDVRPAG